MSKATTAGKPIDYAGFLADAHWWFFCFVILALNFLLLAFDPLPKLFMGRLQEVTYGQHCQGRTYPLLTGHFYTAMSFAGHRSGREV